VSGQAKGVDVSSWQHPGGAEIDWHAVVDAGYTFAIVKATQGTTYANNWLARDLDDARAAGLLVGAYHFYEAGQDAGVQAKHFVGMLMGQQLELGVWLDWEPGPMPDWNANTEYQTFLTACEETRPNCGLYCAQSWLEPFKTTGAPIRRLWLSGWDGANEGMGALIYQHDVFDIPGIATPVNTNTLTSTRGLNIPTAPRDRPTAATTHSMVVQPEPEPEPEEPEPPEPTEPSG
jgi:lysozyme